MIAGHGTSARELNETRWQDWEQSAADAFETLAARCDRVAVAGLSMGGLLALRLCLVRRADVAAIVLMGVPLWFSPGARTLVSTFLRLGFPWAFPKLSGSDVSDRANRRENPAYDRLPIRGVAQLMALQEALRGQLGAIETPALVLHGKRDHTAPPACAPAICDALGGKDVRMRWLPRSYHLLPIDVEREQVAEMSGEFLEEKLRSIPGAGEQT
jgi:carboxylesterase